MELTDKQIESLVDLRTWDSRAHADVEDLTEAEEKYMADWWASLREGSKERSGVTA